MRRSVLIGLVIAMHLFGCGPRQDAPRVDSGIRELNGTSLFVKTVGSGEPVIVIHGGPVLEHGYLLPHLEPLAEGYRLIFFDQRLSGRSTADVEPSLVRMEQFVKDIEALRESEGLERFHLMAHSWGGLIAMHYAIAHGDRLRSLTLLDSMPGSSELWQQEQAELGRRVPAEDRAARQAILDSDAYARKEADTFVELYRLSFRSQFHRPELVDRLEFYIAPDLEQRSERFAAITQDLRDYDIHLELARVSVPVLLLYGSDEVSTSTSGPVLAEHLREAEFVVIPDAGHFPFVEQRDAVLDRIRVFLSEHG